MECNYAPFNWTTTEAGETAKQISSVDFCDGYDVVIATEIAEGLGMDVEIVKTDWDNLIPSLNNGEIDAIIAGMTDTPTRRESVNFTTPYYVSEEVVIVRKDSDVAGITSIQELSGKKVVGQMGTLYDEIIDQINGVIHVEAATDFPAAINALQHGDVDAVTSELPVAIGVTSANSDLAFIQFEKGKGFDGEEDATVSIAVSKDNAELQAKIQEILDTISEEDRNNIMQAAVERQPAVNE
ncbi:MAG TPA: ABC transporter substrate-binding protein [Erysipelotrichaceae bacterium]|nr:ABC transporter substrate-binding protein [Erysipelotrichaceae bacterium]